MGHFFKFKKGSPEARAHMAKIRAMRGKKPKKNPLTRKESADLLNYAKSSVERVRKMRDRGVRAFQAGRASGMSSAVAMTGPREAERSARKIQARAFDEALYPYKTPYVGKRKRNPSGKCKHPDGMVQPDPSNSSYRRCMLCGAKVAWLRGPAARAKRPKCPYCKSETDFLRDGSCRYCGKGGRKRNPPLLIIGNPGGKRRRRRVSQKARRMTNPGAGPAPAGFPAHIWRDPAFQRELKVFRARHGSNIPIKVSKVNIPAGYPKYMTAYGTASHAVYDTPKQSKRGKYIHHFGKKGKNRPFLVSSAARGPKWLGYAGGRFTARKKWLYD